VLVDEVVRRNRRRIAVMTAIAVANYWVLVSAVVGLVLWGKLGRREVGVPAAAIAGASLATGAVTAAWLVAKELRSMRTRTLDGLGAVEIGPGELPVVENLLHELGIAIGAPPVRAALVADDAPNALAVGCRPEDTTIAVTSGLIQKLTRDELEAVLAAELWAVRRCDTAMQTVTLACAGEAIAMHHGYADRWKDPRSWLWIAVTFPTMVVADILRYRMLRNADFGADALAVATTRHPDALRRAMTKLRADPAVVETLSLSTAPLWFEPIPHSGDWRAEEFEAVALTPSLDERLARLDEHGGGPPDHLGTGAAAAPG
jgi:heat shock protein HtpX